MIDMMRRFERNPFRELPDGTIARVYPFHVSLEGLESKVLCRENSDYDAFVKIICICARRKNVILIIYAVVSNHAHCVILAADQAAADSFAQEVKRMYPMYYSRKYSDTSVMRGVDVSAIWLDTDAYLRNAIAYVVRNAVDNGASSVQDYPWTGFRGMFCGGTASRSSARTKVCALTKRERRRIMHTDDDLRDVTWLLDSDLRLEPVSICDWRYVEEAFNNEQSFFLRLIGAVNTAQMQNSLIDSPRIRMADGKLIRVVDDVSERWFKKSVRELPDDKKARILLYVCHTHRTNVAQLARVFELSREEVERMLGYDRRKVSG